MAFEPILTQRLRLRLLTEQDAQSVHDIIGDADNMQYYPRPYSLDEALGWIRWSIDMYASDGHGFYAIERLDNVQFIGICGISNQLINGSMVKEIGYLFLRSAQGNGYATEAAKAVEQYGFNHLQFPRLYIHTYIKNTPSQAVAKRLGFHYDCTYPKAIKGTDLVWDHVVYFKDHPNS